MVRLAAIYDREDGAKNLLMLNGKNGYAWNTDVYVEYLNDGSIRIAGTSDKRFWWPIGEVTLNLVCTRSLVYLAWIRTQLDWNCRQIINDLHQRLVRLVR